MTRPRITTWGSLVALFVIVIAIVLWASDKITLEGERTIYSVQCRDGSWQGWRCTGVLIPSDRYRFRASRARQEVIFWIAGSKQPSGKYSDCVVKDRDNWTCNATPDQTSAITEALVNGKPDSSGPDLAIPIHAVRKWKWWLLYGGIRGFSNADY